MKKQLERIEQLSALTNGWYDSEGCAITSEAINSAKAFLLQRPFDFYIYPTVDGGLLFEISINDWDYSIEFATNGYMTLHGTYRPSPIIGMISFLEQTKFISFLEQTKFIELFDEHIKENNPC